MSYACIFCKQIAKSLLIDVQINDKFIFLIA